MSIVRNQDITNVSNRDSFRFRQFSVSHSRCAMKVGTDGVLLGSWAAVNNDCRVVWDVGAGSGLIALMLAQRCNAEIYGIEINPEASADMSENFMHSPWSDRLHAVNDDINSCAVRLPSPDLIVCNPPFFINSLSNPDPGRQCARHEASLGCAEIIRLAADVLNDGGQLALICPTDRTDTVEWESALAGMSVVSRVDVVTLPGKAAKRTLWLLTRGKATATALTIESMRDSDGNYSEWYIKLTKDFYLHLNG